MELYDEQAELDAAWCDRCMAHHGGPCPPEEPEDFWPDERGDR